MIDMQKFCADAEMEPYRPYLHKPFSKGNFSYATDGIIMVRVSRQEAIPEIGKGPSEDWNPDIHFATCDTRRFVAISLGHIPEAPAAAKEECDMCEGRGYDHGCPDCECECDTCNGTGEVIVRPKVSTTIAGCNVQLHYALMMLAIPGVVVASETADGEPLIFKFNGGIGALMPIRSRFAEHVEIEAEKVMA